MRGEFHRLRVIATQPETPQATSVVFQVPPARSGAFRWRAGQHITLRLEIDGTEVRRTYSISDTPADGAPLRITVKRVAGGLVSNHINDHVGEGDTMEVLPPFGGFCLDTDPQARRTHYFLGAGSGITPLFAMIRSILAAEPHSVARLAYGNANADAIIFREALARLEASGGGRLTVRHILSAPSDSSTFGYWRHGRIDADAVAAFIDAHPPYAQDARYYVCGPGGMNAAVRAALRGLDVPDVRIQSENFGAVAPPDDSVLGVAAEARVRLNDKTLTVPIAAGQTVLHAVRAAGGMPPYSCESGVCGACRAWLRNGAAHQRARMALTDAEVASGVVLTCQALPTTPRLTVDYE